MIKTKYGVPIKIIGESQFPGNVMVTVLATGRVADIRRDAIALTPDEIEKVLSVIATNDLGCFPFVNT